ncbi:helix-turn-helix transcriptional regulator [Streptomyces lydicus]|nr:helix-turn-helix transcriptional regulator [Streptomyces lydicus]
MREVRRSQGLSQGDLAGDDLSPSYVSLVENGRRVPGTKIARSLAQRLGTTVEALCATDEPGDRLTRRLGLVGQLVAARSSQLAGDWPAARRQLESVVEQAGTGHDEVRWEAHWELATVLGRLDDPARHEAALRHLLDDPLTRSAPVLHARVAVELAQLLRAASRLADGARFAGRPSGSPASWSPAAPSGRRPAWRCCRCPSTAGSGAAPSSSGRSCRRRPLPPGR